MKKQTIISFLAAMLLASCSSEDSADLTQLSAPVPLTLNVEVGAGVSTRTENATTEKGTSKNIKDGTIYIYRHDKDGKFISGYNKTYTVDENGNVTSDDPFYYDTMDKVYFRAMAVYNNTTDNLQYVKDNDYLYIEPTVGQVTVNGGAIKLEFKHAASRLSFNVTNGDDVSKDDLENATFYFCGLCKKDSYNNSSGSFTGNESSITINNSKSHLVVPQTSDKLQASITMNGVEYKTPTFSMTLVAGKSYTCNITVSKTGINITSWNITDWTTVNGGTLNQDTKTPIYTYGSIPYASSDVKQYALAFTDGSFENLLEGTATVPDTAKISKLNTLQLNNVCGIVYYLCNPTTDDSELKSDYPHCSHGLIVSLLNITTTQHPYEQNNKVSNDRMCWSEYVESIPYIQENSNKQSNPGKGYMFTKYLKSYNASQTESTSKVYPVDALVAEYNEASPSGSSGWFIPSISELYKMLEIYENMESILSALSDRGKSVTKLFFDKSADNNGSDSYWNSSENGKNTSKAWSVNKSLKIESAEKNKQYYHVRPVCAF